jgi:hypothetical protein
MRVSFLRYLCDLLLKILSVLQWFQFLFFCEDSAPVGQVGVREFPITSNFSPITLVAACRAVFSCC